ncbi:MAG: S9 family peptidase [Chloroflexota bacterium]|nr:S9 family peptidase [Chloroflexota bacterium]
MTEKRPIELDDLFHLRAISDARLSPDGKRVAFVVSRPDAESNLNQSTIWLAPTNGSEAPAALFDSNRDSSPRWSPDGTHLAFVREVDGIPQIAVSNLTEGRSVRLLTNHPTGGTSPTWSPDRSSIAFLAAVPVPPEDVEPSVDASDSARRIVVIERLKHKLDGSGFYLGTRRHVWVVPATGGPCWSITEGDWDADAPAWSPDGSTIAFTASAGPDSDRALASDVYLTPATGGEIRAVTNGQGLASLPSWSPDGQSLAFYSHQDPGAGEGGNAHVWVADLASGDVSGPSAGDDGGPSADVVGLRDLTPDLDTTATGWLMTDISLMEPRPPAWSSDGNDLYFHAVEAGSQPLYRVAADGAREQADLAPVTPATTVVDSFDIAGDTFVYTSIAPTQPVELIVAKPDGSSPHVLADLNREWLSGVQLIEPKEFRFEGADGQTIHGWYLPPAGTSVQAPLVLSVHGGPHGGFGRAFVLEFQLLAAAGYGVLYLNPRGSIGYGRSFAFACRQDWGGKDFADLMHGVDYAVEQGWADPTRVGITGLSYGGYMTNWAVGQTDRFAAAVSYNGIANWTSHYGMSDFGAFLEWEFGGAPWDTSLYHERSPLSHAYRATTPLLLLHSESDLRCPVGESEQMFVAYRSRGAPAVFVRYPGESHLLSWLGSPAHKFDRLARTLEWFKRHMPVDKTTGP